MKTLHLTNMFHPSSGGIHTFYRALLAAAPAHRRQIRLVVPWENDGTEDVNDHARIYYVRAPRHVVVDSRYRVILPHRFVLPYPSRLRTILRQEQADLVEICDKYSLVYLAPWLRKAWIRGVNRPAIVGLTCERMDDNVKQFVLGGAPGERLARYYMHRAYLPMFDFHIAISDYAAEELVAANQGHTKHRREVWVCPLGVDSEQFRPSNQRERLRLEWIARVRGGPETHLLLYAGRLSQEKNLLLLARTMELLYREQGHDHRLLIAGDGPQRDALAAELERVAPGRALFLGHLRDRKQLTGLYAAADAFVHPNPREPFGIAPLEAMAAGLPLIAPREGGILSYANQANAWLAQPTGEDFAAKIREAFAHPELRASKCAVARKTAEGLSWERVTAQYFALYDELHGKLCRWRAGARASRSSEPAEPALAAPRMGLPQAARLVYAWNDVFRQVAAP